MTSNVDRLIENLKTELLGEARAEARAELAAQLTNSKALNLTLNGVVAKPRRGRPPGSKNAVKVAKAAKPAKKSKASADRYRCPVPRCQNPAAPRFGMVCGKHKDLPKAEIKKYREARKAKKA